jgi:hypothetical protein
MRFLKNMRPGPRWLFRLFLVLFFALSFFSYLTFDFEHPASHTSGTATQCECPGDDAPDPGSIPAARVSVPSQLTFIDLFIHDRPEPLSLDVAWVRPDLPEAVPRLLLDALPTAVLLI